MHKFRCCRREWFDVKKKKEEGREEKKKAAGRKEKVIQVRKMDWEIGKI